MSERESMPCDVVIIGGGVAGLAAAIRLKQINEDLEVVVLEKGSEIGAHILSGAVVDPKALDELLPEWRDMDCPMAQTPVGEDLFYTISETGASAMPHIMFPPFMSNVGCYTGSLESWRPARASCRRPPPSSNGSPASGPTRRRPSPRWSSASRCRCSTATSRGSEGGYWH